MSPSRSAMYNSAESHDVKRGVCAPGTRKAQINQLLEWAHDPETGQTCWMNGMAGTGKTTIAYSVYERLDQACQLGASFFCSRTMPECRQIKYIIPTIAYQLARFSIPFRNALYETLESDPDAHTRILKLQYEKLIVGPLSEVKESLPANFIVVIDALDECENEDATGGILDLLLSTVYNLPVRYLVSSRPDREITRRMAKRENSEENVRLVLHNLDADKVKLDIEVYMRHELQHIPLTDDQWVAVIGRCGVLFIYASTICRYITQAYEAESLSEAVDTIMSANSGSFEDGDENAIDELYMAILIVAFSKPRTIQANTRWMRSILDTIICAIEPMKLETIAEVMGLGSTERVDALLKPLRSVVNVTEETGLVTTLHASFPDFMLSANRAKQFWCEKASRNQLLAEMCLQTIDRAKPAFNICNLPSSYLLDNEVEDLEVRVDKAISSALAYSCRHWSTHLHLGQHRGELINNVRHFFLTKLLLWIEVMNLTKRIRHATAVIQYAQAWCNVSLSVRRQVSRPTPM
ncbi:hypothetical protein BN14_05320 [Rhizoctonia solani AG-1 IB]|uniref:NACHT domain-containing protein n=1 Tax=Thanatephorus cucumeris (strain AG1-IB / isolate 7/3/14) TaxID=1108050 RepID=M5BVM5_THACB|nr:hypothetical protein BN14_05320 [Rhizoctonia solani AG-1 IB]